METKQRCQCKECKIKPHYSDCAVHNEPAFPNKDCNCNFMTHDTERAKIRSKIKDIIEHPLLEYHTTESHHRPQKCVEGDIDAIMALVDESYQRGLKMIETSKLGEIQDYFNEEGRKLERTALREKVIKEFEQRAVDKAEILKNNGYGNPPVLFEKSEVIKILLDLLNQ